MNKEKLKEQLKKEENNAALKSYAEQVKNNPVYVNAINLIEFELLDKIKTIDIDKINEIKEIKRELKTLDSFKTKLERVMQTGSIAETKIAKIKKLLRIQ